MGQISEYFAGELLKLAFNRNTYTPVYDRFEIAGVLEVPPLNADTTQVVEPVGLGYSRPTIPFLTANWTAANPREVYNATDITFPVATGFWGTLEGYAVFTSHSVNAITKQMVAVGRFVVPVRVTTDIQPILPAGTVLFGIYD